MFDLPALALLVAFVAVGLGAWFLGRRAGSARTVRLPRDYYVGLDHLVNDRFDRAAEVLTRMVESDGDAAELQLALAALFRRRGEVDRAIALHERLRAQGAPALRERATFELGRDYLSAGLMDRAERIFGELRASSEYREPALDQLVRLYEQQGDWGNALRTLSELPPRLQTERRREAGHFLCELAEHALVQGEIERARILVREAHAREPALARTLLLEARIAETAGERAAALERYLRALGHSPELALEVAPRALALAQSLGEEGIRERLASDLIGAGRLSERQAAWLLATAVPEQDSGTPEGTEESPRSLAGLLARIGEAGGRYLCQDCGLQSVGWFWRCPKCRSWDSLRPAVLKWSAEANSR